MRGCEQPRPKKKEEQQGDVCVGRGGECVSEEGERKEEGKKEEEKCIHLPIGIPGNIIDGRAH